MLTSRTVLALALTACVAETEPETSESELLLGCPKWGCGENTPVMGPYDFWELNVNGLISPDQAPVRILNFQIGNTIYQPQIINGSQLVAVHSNGGSVSGVALTNGFFNIWTPTGVWKIIVAKVNPKATSNVTFWLGPPQTIETYELLYTGPGATGRLCNNPPRSRDSGEGGIWVAPYEAILFTGDRYNADDMRVTAATYGGTTGWFNIGCAGSVLAKLHLNRHTTAGSTFGWATGPSQRQTLLKMYVSDVCGDGTRWTKAGTPLHWENTTGWSTLDGLEFAFESQWGPDGALCMDTHRLGNLYKPNIDASCAPQACNGSVSSPAFSSSAYIVSAVPFSPF